MELLNSKVNHKDYMCDKTPWGVELCKTNWFAQFQIAIRYLSHADR